MYFSKKAIYDITTLCVKLQEKFSNLFSFMLRDRFSQISSLFFQDLSGNFSLLLSLPVI